MLAGIRRQPPQLLYPKLQNCLPLVLRIQAIAGLFTEHQRRYQLWQQPQAVLKDRTRKQSSQLIE
jgi:hypothetical protein